MNKMHYFYDTNVLLHGDYNSFDNFFICDITLKELEQIKTSRNKDDQIKYKARRAVNWLYENKDKYDLIFYKPNNSQTNDEKIISTAIELKKEYPDLIFITYDLLCGLLAERQGLNVEIKKDTIENLYTGYTKLICQTDDELADFYHKVGNDELSLDLHINEYLLIYDCNNNLIDKYKYLGNNKYQRLTFIVAESKAFGKIKPIDPYQELLMDSFKSNQLTLVKGPAGTGKSLLSLAYLFKCLEQGKINKIIIFCNTVATAGSAKLGYYPGNRTEKLLDSQIGNFLISKLGGRIAVEQLIDQEQLLLLPMSDIRGFDTSGMKAGIYITQAQNLNVDLLKLALQRIGEDSICILDGDNETQVDLNLYAGNNNGIKRVSQVFRNQSFYGQVSLNIIHRSRIANIANKM